MYLKERKFTALTAQSPSIRSEKYSSYCRFITAVTLIEASFPKLQFKKKKRKKKKAKSTRECNLMFMWNTT
jgi:hypothetical protein